MAYVVALIIISVLSGRTCAQVEEPLRPLFAAETGISSILRNSGLLRSPSGGLLLSRPTPPIPRQENRSIGKVDGTSVHRAGTSLQRDEWGFLITTPKKEEPGGPGETLRNLVKPMTDQQSFSSPMKADVPAVALDETPTKIEDISAPQEDEGRGIVSKEHPPLDGNTSTTTSSDPRYSTYLAHLAEVLENIQDSGALSIDDLTRAAFAVSSDASDHDGAAAALWLTDFLARVEPYKQPNNKQNVSSTNNKDVQPEYDEKVKPQQEGSNAVAHATHSMHRGESASPVHSASTFFGIY